MPYVEYVLSGIWYHWLCNIKEYYVPPQPFFPSVVIVLILPYSLLYSSDVSVLSMSLC